MPGVFLLPDGPKNLTPLYPGVDWTAITEYYVQGLSGGTVVCTTVVNKPCMCNNDESVTVHFCNYLGKVDEVIFPKPHVIHEASGSEFINGLSDPLEKQDTGIERFNVRSNDTYEAKRKCTEAEMIWLQECMDSPKAYLEWNGTEDQADDFLPIVILNGKFDKLKNDREFEYDFILQWKFSNEYISLRN